MRRWFVTLAILTHSLVPLAADVTITQTITREWPGAAGRRPATASPGQPLPKSTMRIKGIKARSDIEIDGQTVIAITDLGQKQVTLLEPQTKTARVVTPGSASAGAGGMTHIDVSFRRTGKSLAIDGVQCDEHSFTLTLGMAEMGGQAQVPPEAAAMLKDVTMVMNGSVWVAKDAPGAAEFTAFNKAALASQLLPTVSGLIEMKPGQWGGLDKLMAVSAAAPGLPYRTEATLTFEGSGRMADFLKRQGALKMIQNVVSVSTDVLADHFFTVPEGYAINK